MRIVKFILCLLFGLMFINAGLNKFFNYIPMEKPTPEQMKLFAAFWRNQLADAFSRDRGSNRRTIVYLPKNTCLRSYCYFTGYGRNRYPHFYTG